MKGLLSRLLAVFGLVPARRYRALVAQVEQLKTASLNWKTQAVTAMDRSKTFEKESRRHAQLVEKLRASGEASRERDDMTDRLRTRLVDAERELIAAREHLMAIEVKLDILEGAANVLDARLRTAVTTSASGERHA